MKERIVSLEGAGDFTDRLDGACFVVCRHHGYQDCVGANRLGDCVSGYTPVAFRRDNRDIESALLKSLDWFQDGFVFDCSRNYVLAPCLSGILFESEDRKIVALGGSASEDHLVGFC